MLKNDYAKKSKTSDADKDKKETGQPTPHPDAEANLKFFDMIMKKVQVLNENFKWEIQDSTWDTIFSPEINGYEGLKKIKEAKCAIFIWHEKGTKMFTVLSFHEKNAEFRDLLAWFLNRMGQIGMITKKKAEYKKASYYIDPDDKYGNGLFA